MTGVTAIMAGMRSAGPVVQLSNVTDVRLAIAGNDAVASYALRANGTTDTHSGQIGDWLNPREGMSAYECRVTVTSGSLGGTTGTWLPLNLDREWQVIQSGIGTSRAVFTVEIRLIGGSSSLASAVIDLAATVEV